MISFFSKEGERHAGLASIYRNQKTHSQEKGVRAFRGGDERGAAQEPGRGHRPHHADERDFPRLGEHHRGGGRARLFRSADRAAAQGLRPAEHRPDRQNVWTEAVDCVRI